MVRALREEGKGKGKGGGKEVETGRKGGSGGGVRVESERKSLSSTSLSAPVHFGENGNEEEGRAGGS
jgi:hypothetical protein